MSRARITTRIAIGVVLAAALVFAIASRFKTRRYGESMRAWAMFRDGSRLPVGSGVRIAGLQVGEIDGLFVENRYARVTMVLRDDVVLWDNAFVEKKASSLLGDYYVEVNPGSAETVEPDGSVTKNVRIEPGGQILHVVEASSTDSVFRDIHSAMPKVETALGKITSVVESGRNMVNGPAAAKIEGIRSYLDSESATAPIRQLERGADVLDSFTAQAQPAVHSFAADTDKTLANLERRIADSTVAMRDVRERLATAAGDARRAMGTWDESVVGASSSLAAVDDGEGTLGRLIDDDELGEEIDDVSRGLADSTASFSSWRTYIGLRQEFNLSSLSPRFYVRAEFHTRPGKYYLLELEKSPRGAYPDISLELDPGTDNWHRRVLIEERVRVTFQLAKRLGRLWLRGGMKESTPGIGADLLGGYGFTLSADLFDLDFEAAPRLKLGAGWQVSKTLHVVAGVDDLLNGRKNLPIAPWPDTADVPIQFDELSYGRDVFVGAMLRFEDVDLRTLLMVYGAVLAGFL